MKEKMMLFLIAPLLLVACNGSKSYVDQETFENHLSAIDDNQFSFAEMKVNLFDYIGFNFPGQKGGSTQKVSDEFTYQYYAKENRYITDGGYDFFIYLKDIKEVYENNEVIDKLSNNYTRKYQVDPLTIHYENPLLKADFIFDSRGQPINIKIDQKGHGSYSPHGKYTYETITIYHEYHLKISIEWSDK